MRAEAMLVPVLVMAMAFSCDGSTGPRGFPHAVATRNCGPADGPATSILLARNPIPSLAPDYPYVQINIWQAVNEIAGRTYLIGDTAGGLTARYYAASGQFAEASAGSVRISRVDSDNRVVGAVELRFPTRFVSEGFSAPWIESLVLCG
jgi:hypothetical protein